MATIGYEGATLADFVAALEREGIRRLADVRDIAWSRKRDFCKTPLSAGLEAAGIDYVHLKGLGNPKPGRDAAKSGDLPRYRRIYGAHLESATARADLAALAQLARAAPTAIMCLEKDPARCHRAMVAEALEREQGFAIRHLYVEPDLFSR